MPRRRHTRLTDPALAGTVQKSLRLPEALVNEVTSRLEQGVPDIHNLTDVVTDALWLWLAEHTRLQPAFGSPALPTPAQAVAMLTVRHPPAEQWKQEYGEVTIGSGEGETLRYDPPSLDLDAEIIDVTITEEDQVPGLIEPKEEWDGDGIEVDHGPGKPFQGAGLVLPQDAERRRPTFDKVDIDSYVVD
jgi:hypothetical protein